MTASEVQEACLHHIPHPERKEEGQVEVVVSSLGEVQVEDQMVAWALKGPSFQGELVGLAVQERTMVAAYQAEVGVEESVIFQGVTNQAAK